MNATVEKMAHTPGPWKFVVDRDGLTYRLCGDGMWFAKMSWTVTSERNHADARLISTAPDLLAALTLVRTMRSVEALSPAAYQSEVEARRKAWDKIDADIDVTLFKATGAAK